LIPWQPAPQPPSLGEQELKASKCGGLRSEAIVVTGMSCETALGGLASTWRSLLLGRSGIQIRQPFLDLPPLPLAMLGETPQSLETLTQKIVRSAIVDAGLTLPLVDCAIVLGSSRGNQRLWEAFTSDPQPDLRHWDRSFPHRGAVLAAEILGSRGEVQAPMAACSTGLVAIAQGFRLIEAGYADRVVVGAIESPITPLTLAGFTQMGALAKTGAYPFDLNREGLVLGEGGAVLILERESLARSRNAQIYGRVLGIGLTNDAHHLSAPEPMGTLATRSIDRCLAKANLTPVQIQYIHAHGTGTRLNDAREAHLFQTQFPTASISSTKGATGHTLGASGAIGAVFCLQALRHQTLPPCVGLVNPEAAAIDWVRESRKCPVQHALCLSFGFGGQNSAIVFGVESGREF
jgi:3-oxoacyl-[acyl-carrier-protein] synthase II